MDNKLISHALVLQHKPGDAKLMYLVGVHKTGEQELITIRYRKPPVPVIQLCEHNIREDGSIHVFFSDISINHTNETISGGVPTVNGSQCNFVYYRRTLKLFFFTGDPGKPCEVMTDTAMPFVELIARM